MSMKQIKVNLDEAKRVIELCNRAPYFTLRYKNNEEYAYIRVSTDIDNQKQEFDSWADKELLEAVEAALNGTSIDLEAYINKEHTATRTPTLGIDKFTFDVLNKKVVIVLDDYVTSKGVAYMCARSLYEKGEIYYCLKRTAILEEFLSEQQIHKGRNE